MTTDTTAETHLEYLCEALRFPSVSTDPAHNGDVRACAEWLRDFYTGMGLDCKIHETPGHPVVLAKSKPVEGRPTVLIYGHYDVQPPDPLDLWETGAFEPTLRDGKVYARGAVDNKGQFMAHSLGIRETLLREGELPVNVILLIEGEEEIGSPNLEPFVREHQEELRADVVAISDTGMLAPGVPTFTYGLRGVAACEVFLEGAAGDLHSGVYGGSVVNPATVLAHLLGSLHETNWRIAVPGFYENVRPLEDWERTAWAELPLTDKRLLEVTGAPELNGEPGFSSLERAWARPTIEVNGITAGYQGAGTKTVLPAKASAKLSIRLVPEQDPAELLQKLELHLRSHLPLGVRMRLEKGHVGPAYLMDPHSAHGHAAQVALEKTFDAKVALICEGGSIPIVQTFRDVLGVDTLLLGLALPDANMHAPNENFLLENFHAGIKLNQELLKQLAAQGAGA